MASIFSKIILFSALVLVAFGGYLFFVSNYAPNFNIFGNVDELFLIIFLSSGFLIVIWIILQILNKSASTHPHL